MQEENTSRLGSCQWDEGYQVTIDGLIGQVERAFESFDPRSIDKGFLTLQTCMDEIQQIHGDNAYKIPHIGKDSILRADGRLPARLECTDRAKEVCLFVMEGVPIDHGDHDDDDASSDANDSIN